MGTITCFVESMYSHRMVSCIGTNTYQECMYIKALHESCIIMYTHSDSAGREAKISVGSKVGAI